MLGDPSSNCISNDILCEETSAVAVMRKQQ